MHSAPTPGRICRNNKFGLLSAIQFSALGVPNLQIPAFSAVTILGGERAGGKYDHSRNS
jgi:hypothetical protein